ncbi:hypothetical protein B0T19DRAFT_192989 [Cercophora scortea]|uniref:Uncharacterized protein n=1 Tax=Cercophora scortea TaxID=314031 RepID=A0AAE0INI9_9PEZI|nr:hypothetical protein B0T19DRAFT_192989 [Cercophora scortea]
MYLGVVRVYLGGGYLAGWLPAIEEDIPRGLAFAFFFFSLFFFLPVVAWLGLAWLGLGFQSGSESGSLYPVGVLSILSALRNKKQHCLVHKHISYLPARDTCFMDLFIISL